MMLEKPKISINFYKLLLSITAWPIVLTLCIAIIYLLLMSFIDHQALPFPAIVVILSLLKTFLLARTTLKQLSKLIELCNSINKLFWTFGLIIIISILSFATDYNCLFQYDHNSFTGVINDSESYFFSLFNFIYFSTITFSTVGFGDISPLTNVARMVVMLEIFLSFLIIVFAVANIKNIHLTPQKK